MPEPYAPALFFSVGALALVLDVAAKAAGAARA